MGVQFKVVQGVVAGQREGDVAGDGAVVLGDALKAVPGQVQPVPFRVGTFKIRYDRNGLRVVVETAVGGHELGQRVLSGVTEGRVAEVMGQRDGLCQFRVQLQRAGDGAGDLRHLDRMGQAGAEIVALVFDEHLRLVLQPAEGGGMDDPVPVPLVAGAERAFLFRVEPPARLVRMRGIGREHGASSVLVP